MSVAYQGRQMVRFSRRPQGGLVSLGVGGQSGDVGGPLPRKCLAQGRPMPAHAATHKQPSEAGTDECEGKSTMLHASQPACAVLVLQGQAGEASRRFQRLLLSRSTRPDGPQQLVSDYVLCGLRLGPPSTPSAIHRCFFSKTTPSHGAVDVCQTERRPRRHGPCVIALGGSSALHSKALWASVQSKLGRCPGGNVAFQFGPRLARAGGRTGDEVEGKNLFSAAETPRGPPSETGCDAMQCGARSERRRRRCDIQVHRPGRAALAAQAPLSLSLSAAAGKGKGGGGGSGPSWVQMGAPFGGRPPPAARHGNAVASPIGPR